MASALARALTSMALASPATKNAHQNRSTTKSSHGAHQAKFKERIKTTPHVQRLLCPNSSMAILLPRTSCCPRPRGSNTSCSSAQAPQQGGRIRVAEELWPADSDAVCSAGISPLGAEGYRSPRPRMF